MPDIHYREMKAQDIEQIMEIERACFRTPWAEGHFHHELTLSYGYHRVAEAEDEGGRMIVGYIVAWLVQGEFSILNIAVRPGSRERGIGRRLISNALAFAKRKGAGTAWLEVRPSNNAARSLYEKFNFVEVGRRRGYYSDSGEDALVMVRPIQD